MSLDYQTNSALQAFPNHTNTDNKLFLLIYEHHVKYNGRVFMSRDYMATTLGISITHVSRITRKLHKAGLIIKTVTAYDYKRRRCHYKITEQGHYWRPYIVQAYNLLKKVFLSISLLISPGASNVTLVNLNGVRFKNGCSSVRELLTAREANTPSTTLQSVTKKETVMKIPDYVEKLTDILKLTPHGKLKLATFNEPTVQHGFAAIQKTVNCKDVFAEMINQCVSFSSENGYKVDWKGYYAVVESGKIDRKQFYTSKKITSEMVKPRKSILEPGNAAYRSRSDEALAVVRRNSQEKIARDRQSTEFRKKELEYLNNNPFWASMGIQRGADFNHFATVPPLEVEIDVENQPVTKRHDLASSELVSSGCPNETSLEPQISPISKCVVKGGTIMCLARSGNLPKNMVEPEPVDYEQDSIWEEV